jgi:hypothetical protein
MACIEPPAAIYDVVSSPTIDCIILTVAVEKVIFGSPMDFIFTWAADHHIISRPTTEFIIIIVSCDYIIAIAAAHHIVVLSADHGI